MAFHTLRASPDTVRIGVFDARFPPVMQIESGDTVEVQCVSGREEVMPQSGSDLRVPPELASILAANPGMRAGHIVTGPIAVAGAEPGDMLEIRIKAVTPRVPYGVNNAGSGGAAADMIPGNARGSYVIKYDPARKVAFFSPEITIRSILPVIITPSLPR